MITMYSYFYTFIIIIIKQVETTTNPTFDKINQKHFLHSVKKFTKKAAKAREIVIENGKEKTVNEYIVNSENVSQNMKSLYFFLNALLIIV